MTKLIIKDYFDQYQDNAKAGDAVFEASSPLINTGDVIIFDMSGLDSVSTVFLNTSFGHLIDTFGIERVKKSFKFANLLRSQADRIKKYFADYSDLTTANP